MNLFLDAHVFDDSLEGSRTYIKGLYSVLIRENPSVRFFIGAYNIQNLKKEFGEPKNVSFVKFFSKNKIIRLSLNIPVLIKRNKIDLAHYQYITPLFKFSKEIVTIHDVLFLDFPDLFPYGYRFRNKILFNRSARRADYLLTVSEYSRKAISEHLNVKKEKIHVIPNGIADEFFELKKSLPDVKGQYKLDKYILYVSRIEPRKNHFLLLKAFTELNLWKEGYKLVCIGKEYIRSALFFNYLDSLPEEIRKFITIIERSQGDELISFYRNCKLFVYPSLAEGFGIPPLEAVASNVPVLCADTTAMSEYRFLGDRRFDPSSLDELKAKILKSLNSGQRDFRNEIEFVKVNYSWRNSAAKFKDLILKEKNCDS